MQTKDETLELRLSLEEVVVLLNLMGHAQLAGETLRALVGPIAPDEMRGRLLAANRSLLARGIFKLAGDKLQIDPAYARLLMPLADNRFVLRCAAREPGQPEEAVTFYVRDDVVVEQRIAYDVAHTLREVADVAAASAICEAFLGLARPIPFKAVPFSLTDGQLEEARRLVAVEIEQAGVYLRDLGLDDDTNAGAVRPCGWRSTPSPKRSVIAAFCRWWASPAGGGCSLPRPPPTARLYRFDRPIPIWFANRWRQSSRRA